MGVHGGKFGVINNFPGVRNWSINSTSSPKPFVASNTLGGTGRKPGIRDWSGSASLYGGAPTIMPGEYFDFAGYCAPGDDVRGSNGDVYSGNAIVDQIVINWNYETGDIIAHTINFGGNGALAKSSGVYDDDSDPEYHAANEIAGPSVDGEDVCNITTVALTLSCASKPYVNSCTDGWNKRKPGIFDWTLAIAVQDTNEDQFVGSVGDDLDLFLPTTPGDEPDGWRLRWAHFKEMSGISVNPETGDIIAFTANFEKNGFPIIDEAVVAGCVIRPGETEPWWGVAP